MQGFLFSYPAAAGPGRSLLTPTPVVVAYEPWAVGSQRVLFSWPLGGSGWGSPAPFRVVLLYEDFATGKRARKAYRFLAGPSGAGGGFDHGAWRCGSLEGRHLQSRAACEVARADLVILSVHRDLPAGTGALLGAWLAGKRRRDSALVAMVDDAGAPAIKAGGSAPARLARLARHHGLSFVHERFEVLDGPGRGSWEVVWVF
jgi:hypothetical protein